MIQMNKVDRVRAIIIKNDQILTLKRIKKTETYYTFPGGGVEKGETNEEAIKRECLEELGVNIKVFKLLKSLTITNLYDLPKHIQNFYVCEIIDGELGTGNGPEYQEGSHYEGEHIIKWLNIKDLKNIDLRPIEMKDIIIKL